MSDCLSSVLYLYFAVQCPSTSARLQMVDAAIYVFFPLVGNTNVPVPQTFTLLPTTKPASPTAPPVRSAPFFLLPHHVYTCCDHVVCSSVLINTVPPEGKLLHFHGLFFLTWRWRKCLGIDFNSGFEERRSLTRQSRMHVDFKLCSPTPLLFCLFYSNIVSLWDRWVHPFLVEVWHGGWLWGWLRWTPWLP